METPSGNTDVDARIGKDATPSGDPPGRFTHHDVVVRSQGAYLWTADGSRLIDLVLADGAIVVGHSDPRIIAAAMEAAATCDVTLTGPQPGEAGLAEAVAALLPSAEQVVFVDAELGALLLAVRVARVATGRRRLLALHDHPDGGLAGRQGKIDKRRHVFVMPTWSGISDEYASFGLIPEVVDWRDISAVRAAFREYGTDLAVVVLEPRIFDMPTPRQAVDVLSLVRELSTQAGAVLVFDESMSAFRVHLGGYQALTGVTPDLTLFGRTLGNGFTMAGLAGRADLIEHLPADELPPGVRPAPPYALAAGLATVRLLRNGGCDYLAQLGNRLRSGLERVIADERVAAHVAGIGASFALDFHVGSDRSTRYGDPAAALQYARFQNAMADAGMFLPETVHATGHLCLASSDEDVDQLVEAAAWAFGRIA